MTRPGHPAGSYVGLYGSHGGDWRRRAKTLLEEAGVAWHDPTDRRWEEITHENGDRYQDVIDELVSDEHEAIHNSAAAIFHLAGGPSPPASLAARFELGLLTGRGIPTFVHVDPRALGRNYVWAAVKLYSELVSCQTLEDAVSQAVEKLKGTLPLGS